MIRLIPKELLIWDVALATVPKSYGTGGLMHTLSGWTSPNMIMQAKSQLELPNINWMVGDAGSDLYELGKFDIIFS